MPANSTGDKTVGNRGVISTPFNETAIVPAAVGKSKKSK